MPFRSSLSVRSHGVSVLAASSNSQFDLASSLDTVSELPAEEVKPLLNPQVAFIDDVRRTDVNEIINTGILVGIAVFVLWNLATIDSCMSRGWTAGEVAARIPLDVWGSYTEVLNQEPIFTKATTSATVRIESVAVC